MSPSSSEGNDATDREPTVFISHKHSDKSIADVVRHFIEDRSGGRITVFQSSSEDAQAPRLGRNLNQELCTRLWQTGLLLLIYTSPDDNWDYCMWECGVALRPSSPDTRTIVFQCGPQTPKVFADQVRVDARSLANIQQFTNELMTSVDFMVGLDAPLTRFDPNATKIQEAAQELHANLEKVIPAASGDEDVNVWPPYPFIKLQVSSKSALRVKNADSEKRPKIALEVTRNAVVLEMDSEARRLFGIAGWRPDLTVDSLVKSWQGRYPHAEPIWLNGVATQVAPAILNQFPTLDWQLMRGVDERDQTLYAPVVNQVREIADHQYVFDVYFNKFELDLDEKHVKVTLP